MTHKRKTRIVREVEKCLKATGLSWRLEPGSKHWRVILAEECIGVLSYGTAPNQDARNLKTIIEKKAKAC